MTLIIGQLDWQWTTSQIVWAIFAFAAWFMWVLMLIEWWRLRKQRLLNAQVGSELLEILDLLEAWCEEQGLDKSNALKVATGGRIVEEKPGTYTNEITMKERP